MRYVFKVFVLVLFTVLISNAQDLSREQKLQKIEELNKQIKTLENSVILPDAKDLKKAQELGLDAFRLMPREEYDHKLTVQGGGSYYSFTTKSHDYQKIAQIGLEQNNVKVGFAGADYGFIADVGEISLTDISKENAESNFLVNYKPPTILTEIRLEQRKAWNYEVNGITYKSNLPAFVGHTYVLRAISFDAADVLVAFQIHRKDADGSLIIFWKLIEYFKIPRIEKNNAAVNIQPNSDTENKVPDYAAQLAIQTALTENGLNDVLIEATTTEIILRGIVPKGKMADAVRITQETAKRKVNNQLTEQK